MKWFCVLGLWAVAAARTIDDTETIGLVPPSDFGRSNYWHSAGNLEHGRGGFGNGNRQGSGAFGQVRGSFGSDKGGQAPQAGGGNGGSSQADFGKVKLEGGFQPIIQHHGHVKAITITKEVRVPYPVTVEKKVPYEVKVPIDKPYPVYVPKPYPVIVEKKVPFEVKVPVPQPYPVEKHVPFVVKVPVVKHFPVYVDKNNAEQGEKKAQNGAKNSNGQSNSPAEKPASKPVQKNNAQSRNPIEKPKPAAEKPIPFVYKKPVPYAVRQFKVPPVTEPIPEEDIKAIHIPFPSFGNEDREAFQKAHQLGAHNLASGNKQEQSGVSYDDHYRFHFGNYEGEPEFSIPKFENINEFSKESFRGNEGNSDRNKGNDEESSEEGFGIKQESSEDNEDDKNDSSTDKKQEGNKASGPSDEEAFELYRWKFDENQEVPGRTEEVSEGSEEQNKENSGTNNGSKGFDEASFSAPKEYAGDWYRHEFQGPVGTFGGGQEYHRSGNRHEPKSYSGWSPQLW